MDNLSKEKRSKVMASIRSSNNKPELRAKLLFSKFHLIYQPKGISGRPDFASKKYKLVIFIDGCYWHGCRKHFAMPTSNIEYWQKKITRNRNNDKKVTRALRAGGWNVVRIWEHDIMNNPEKCSALVNLQAGRNK